MFNCIILSVFIFIIIIIFIYINHLWSSFYIFMLSLYPRMLQLCHY